MEKRQHRGRTKELDGKTYSLGKPGFCFFKDDPTGPAGSSGEVTGEMVYIMSQRVMNDIVIS